MRQNRGAQARDCVFLSADTNDGAYSNRFSDQNRNNDGNAEHFPSPCVCVCVLTGERAFRYQVCRATARKKENDGREQFKFVENISNEILRKFRLPRCARCAAETETECDHV